MPFGPARWITRAGDNVLYELDGLPAIEADPSPIRQATMNLVIDAYEAIGNRDGHTHLQTGTRRMVAAPKFRSDLLHDMEDGLSVYLRVQDTGCRMDNETQKRIFDPFFTSKFTGRGLGPTMVLGIVRSHKGSLLVDSHIDRGTTLCLQFPAVIGPAVTRLPAERLGGPLRSEGLVLLVDDEPTVREIVGEALQVMGLSTVEAANGQTWVEACEAGRDEFIVVFLDLTMPIMGGEEAFRRTPAAPGVSSILMSGCSEQEAAGLLDNAGLAGFLQKPIKLLDLNRMFQRALTSTRPAIRLSIKPSCSPVWLSPSDR